MPDARYLVLALALGKAREEFADKPEGRLLASFAKAPSARFFSTESSPNAPHPSDERNLS